MDNFKKTKKSDVNAIVVIEAFVNGRRDSTHWFTILPSQKVDNLSVVVVRMLFGQETGQAEESIAEQVTSKWRSPARIAPVETPREFCKDLYPGCPQGYLLNCQKRRDTAYLHINNFPSIIP
jgi:hypothetical protein